MDKRVYGVIGVSSKMANWNADFSGYPRSLSDGTIFGSDKALKYPMRKMWDNEGKKVLYMKSMNFSKKNDTITLVPNSLKERYEKLFAVDDLKKCKDNKEVLTNLMTAVDVKNFGATFAEAKNNISITGAVQFGQGINKFKRTALVAATSFSSNAKEGCQNEFALFVETKLDTYLPNLSEYISFEKADINKIKIECNMLNELEDILNIEIYYNPETTVLESNLEKAKIYNLITKKEV